MRTVGRLHGLFEARHRGTVVVGVFAVLLITSTVLMVSCTETEPTGPSTIWAVTDYSVPIDSMRVVSPIALGDTLRVRLWGEVGPAPCFEFYSIVATHWTDWEVYLNAHGVQRSGGPCDGAITYLDGEEYAYVPPSEGLVRIYASPSLVETVEVVSRRSLGLGVRSN